MKNKLSASFIFLAFFTIINHANAQSVSINNSGDLAHKSAILDISSDGKGLLIPRLTSAQRTSIFLPADGLLVYDTDVKAFWYFKIGTGWAEVGAPFKLPYSGNANTDNGAFSVENTGTGVGIYGITNQNSAAIQGVANGNTSDAIGVWGYGAGNGSVGILGYSENPNGIGASATNNGGGLALQVNGNLNIKGGNTAPGAGKILTSDANGNATWQAPAPKVGVIVNGIAENGLNIINTGNFSPIWNKVHFATVEYDPTNSYKLYDQNLSSTFTAPVDGIYDLSTFLNIDASLYKSIALTSIRFMRRRNNVAENIGQARNAHDVDTDEYWRTIQLNKKTKLLTNDQVWVEVDFIIHNSSTTQLTVEKEFASFSCFLIH